MFRLAYVSRVAGRDLARDLEDILRQSVANNRRDGISGMLICDGLEFAQVLEGERALVETCFERIWSDERNDDLEVRGRGRVAERLFPRWSMCALSLSSTADALLAPGDIELSLRDLAPGALLQHLSGLAQRHGDVLDAQHARLLAG